MESAVQNTFNDPSPVTPTPIGPTASSSGLLTETNDDEDDDADLNHSSSFNSLNNIHESNSHADELNELFTRVANNAAAVAAANRNRPAPPPPPTSHSPQSNLPNVNVLQSRLLSYPTGGTAGVVAPPQGFLGWSIFLVAFPFRFIMSTVYDIFSFFFTMFDRTPPLPIDYDPLANIAEFTIDYNQNFGINHPDFFAGSYSQVKKLTIFRLNIA